MLLKMVLMLREFVTLKFLLYVESWKKPEVTSNFKAMCSIFKQKAEMLQIK